ncbi:hypothetical protein B0T20DRAFT_182236 [Sordaria brevicollis]|uniref:Secreted protein n=1 Tax=Sordaria brevicollis TaxID=83679 RepID=A0AAE0UDP5_SORBR|nr:hypothetical protein B0T20DRAFT_182236 [Sordaria brevicollis]
MVAHFLFMLLAPSRLALAMLSQFFVSRMGSNHAWMLYRAGDGNFGQALWLLVVPGGLRWADTREHVIVRFCVHWVARWALSDAWSTWVDD